MSSIPNTKTNFCVLDFRIVFVCTINIIVKLNLHKSIFITAFSWDLLIGFLLNPQNTIFSFYIWSLLNQFIYMNNVWRICIIKPYSCRASELSTSVGGFHKSFVVSSWLILSSSSSSDVSSNSSSVQWFAASLWTFKRSLLWKTSSQKLHLKYFYLQFDHLEFGYNING